MSANTIYKKSANESFRKQLSSSFRFARFFQHLITQALTNIISHDSSTVEMFLSKYDDVIKNVLDLLQYSPW